MAKNHRRRNIIELDHAREQQQRSLDLIPRNLSQEQYVCHLNDASKHIVLATGPAGTGKTYLAVIKAIQLLKSGSVDRVVLTRPAVSVEEQHGFLPGGINEKMAPWVAPLMDVFQAHYPAKQLANMITDGIIEICPLAYIRGRTFHRAFVIYDEAQNSTISQTKAALTRLGEHSRMVVTGDLEQHDRGYTENGLADFVNRIQGQNLQHIVSVQFGPRDVERSAVVKEVLDVYNL